MTEWWEAMSVTSQIFAIIGIAGTLMLLIQAVLLLAGLGGGSDFGGDVSADVDADAGDGVFGHDLAGHDDAPDSGMRILSLRGVIAFFAVAGWVGVIADKSGAQLWLTILLALACGMATMLLIGFLTKKVIGLQSDGTADIRNAVGKAGAVYLRVPAKRQGAGKVNVLLQDSYVELDAITDEDEDLNYGAYVVVVGVTGGNTLIVKKK